MVYEPGEWTKEELEKIFNFAPEEQESSDPDVLYSGEIIDVGKGGVKHGHAQGANAVPIDSSVIDPMFYNVFTKEKVQGEKVQNSRNSCKVSEKNRASILMELTGVETRSTLRGLKKKRVEVI